MNFEDRILNFISETEGVLKDDLKLGIDTSILKSKCFAFIDKRLEEINNQGKSIFNFNSPRKKVARKDFLCDKCKNIILKGNIYIYVPGKIVKGRICKRYCLNCNNNYKFIEEGKE
jgi:hypothetical protein